MKQSPRPTSPANEQLIEISTKCSATAKELLDELGKLKLDSQGSLRQLIRKSLRTMRRKSFISEVESKLEKYQHTLDTCILTRLDVQSLQQTTDLQNLDQNVQNLIAGLNQGHNTVAQLLIDQNQAIRQGHNAVSQLLVDQKKVIRDIDLKIDDRARADSARSARQQFKDSLFYPEILSRQEQIHHAYHGTCRWIFRPPGSRHGGSNSEGVSTATKGNVDEHNYDKSEYGQSWSNFVDWLENGQGSYWINGKPGSGKSTLMSFLVDEPQTKKCLRTWAKDADLFVVAFFFWNSGTVLQKSLGGLLRSLLYQIADQREDLISIMMEPHRNAATGPNDFSAPAQFHAWTEQRLLSTLRKFLASKPASLRICFFVDGLDEFSGDEEILLETIQLLNDTQWVKACVSSRPELVFKQKFLKSPQLRVQDLNHQDIRRTAMEKLRPHLEERFPRESDQIDNLISHMIFSTQGVFLWLELVIKDIVRGIRHADTLQELHARLNKIPDTVEGLYADMLSRLDTLYLRDGIDYFRLLMAHVHLQQDSSSRVVRGRPPMVPLTLLQLGCGQSTSWEHVLKNDLSYFESTEFHDLCQDLETRIRTRCAGLVEIGKSRIQLYPLHEQATGKLRGEKRFSSYSREVRFIHRTVKDFLEGHRQEFFQPRDWLPATLLTLARSSLGILYIAPLAVLEGVIGSVLLDLSPLVFCVLGPLRVIDQLGNAGDAYLDVVDHTYWIADHIDKRINGSHASWREDFGAYLPLNVHEPNGLVFHNPAGLASYSGIHKFVPRYLSSRTLSIDSLSNLLTCTVFVLGSLRLISRLPVLGNIEMLLHRGVNPNMICDQSLYLGDRSGYRMSLWGVFLFQMGKAYKEYCRKNIERPSILRGLYGEKDLSSFPRWDQVAKAFLSCGADINTSIFLQKQNPRFAGSGIWVVEQSPLAWMEGCLRLTGLSPEASHVAREILMLLRSRGAPKQRQYRMICFYPDPYSWARRYPSLGRSHPWISDPVFYKLSKSQSDRLLDANSEDSRVASSPTDHKILHMALRRALNELRASLTEDDVFDSLSEVISSSHKRTRRASI